MLLSSEPLLSSSILNFHFCLLCIEMILKLFELPFITLPWSGFHNSFTVYQKYNNIVSNLNITYNTCINYKTLSDIMEIKVAQLGQQWLTMHN